MMKEIKVIINEIIQKIEDKGSISAKVYTDEPIIRTASRMNNYLPDEYRAMRELEKTPDAIRNSPAWLFYHQGKLMEHFREDFPFSDRVTCYYPTYQHLSNRELRGYFSWRTKYRDGVIERTSTSFAFLYIYELLNLIGVTSPAEGFQKLSEFREQYAHLDEAILRYLNIWMNDFVIYHGLDASLLNQTDSDICDQLVVLQDYEKHSDEEIFDALSRFASYNIERSKFYREYTDDLRYVAVAVYKALSVLYAKARKNSYFTHLFGQLSPSYYQMFRSAVFHQKKRHSDTVYTVNRFHRYACSNGIWSCERYYFSDKNREIGDILHYIDARMRVVYGYQAQLKEQAVTKQVMKFVEDALGALDAEKKKQEAAKIVIDVSKLQGIRTASEITRDKLIVAEEDEECSVTEMPSPVKEMLVETTPIEPEGGDFGLTEGESAVLHSIIDGTDANLVARQNGLMLSVAIDSINEKLFDEFGDTVIVFEGDAPAVLEDYLDELKGIIK